MKTIKKIAKNATAKKTKLKAGVKPKKPVDKKADDVQKLVHLLQVHQIELEHQNQELRIAQEELEVSRNKYVNLFDFSPIPYFTLDPDSIIKEVNLSASKLLGTDRGKIAGRRFSSYILPDDRDSFNSFIKTIFTDPVKQSCELNVVNKNKLIFHVLLEGLELEDALEPDRRCQVALIDLTEYRKLADSLIKTTEELKLLNSTRDKFFSIIAHDLRSPFQSLLGSSELLATEIDNLSHEEIAVFGRGLNKNLINLYGLLDNLLHWALLQRNLLEYKPVNFNLTDIVNKTIQISAQSASLKNISIYNNVDTRITVYADIDLLRIVIQNLLINAIKFTPKEGQIIVSSIEKDGIAEVSFLDTGIGINPDKISNLFNFDTIFTTEGTIGERGTGLGLPLCKEFIERNGGKISVESEPGKGSKFTFTVPKPIS